MKTVTIPLALCNNDIPKEYLHVYAWCVYLTKENGGDDDWFHIDFMYLKNHTQYSMKKLSLALNYLAKFRVIELDKRGSKQYGRALIQDTPESFLMSLERIEDEYSNLKQTKDNLRNLNYLDPADILAKK